MISKSFPKIASAFFMLVISSQMIDAQKMTYPTTPKTEQKDSYFSTVVNDPYRWLEDDRSVQTQDWVKKENVFTNDYLSKIPFREDIRKQLNEIWNYEKISAPFKKGDYTYFYKNKG